MKAKKAVLAVLVGTAALATAPAFADNGWHRGHERDYRHGPRHYAPVVVAPAPRVVYAPAPVYYRPAPVYYTPAPVYYTPAPAYYAPPPVPVAPAISIRFRLPL
jgi:hypothetical protein